MFRLSLLELPVRLRRTFWSALVAALVLCGASTVGLAADKIQLLVIGNNQASVVDSSGESRLPLLRFADDDAAAFYELMSSVADTAHLLTVLDSETSRRYPELATAARPPTLAALRVAVAQIGKRIEESRAQGHRNVLYIFFSGHGSLVEGQGPTLALLDGGISHEVLYEEILSKLPAEMIHLFVDACHAEAVVRPRDAQAKAVSVTPAEASALLIQSTLSRFPQVGAIVAASSDAQAHEWDLLGHGVFTHELLSALRGAADVNRDGRVEYSEIYAFLGAANRGVDDPRGRLSVVGRPPEVDRHAAVMDLSWFPRGATARLREVPARAGLVQVEDGRGRRLISLHGEPLFVADLLVPAGTTYVRAGGREAQFEARPGQSTSFESLTFRDVEARPRGALESAVRRGLFASEFGRGYYAGFIDQAPDFVPVSFADPQQLRVEAADPAARGPGAPASSATRLMMVGLGASSSVASTLEFSEALRLGLAPAGRRGLSVAVDLARAAQPGIVEKRAVMSLGWRESMSAGPLRGWAGAGGGAGIIGQTAEGKAARWSGMLQAGPSLGASLDVTRTFGFWSEGQLCAMTYRQDDRTTFALGPSAFVGAWLGF